MDRRERAPREHSGRFETAGRILLRISLAGFLLWWLLGLGLFVWHKVLFFDELAFDGAFQLLNPLRRIAAGQTAGVDFQVFHGIGVPYLHYPFYRLAGGTLQASELVRYILSPLLFFVSTAAVGALATRRMSGMIATLVVVIIFVDGFGLNELYIPGIALRGVRSTVPVLAFALLLGLRAGPMCDILLGACLASGFLLGTEHGISLWAGLSFALVVDLALGGPRRPKLNGLIRVQAMGGALLAVCLLLIGGPNGALGALRFAMVEMPADQFWFFGAPPNDFVASRWQLFEDLVFLPPVLLGLLLLIANLLLLAQATEPDDQRFAMASTAFLVYGLISSLAYFGYSSELYMMPLKRVLILVSLAGLWQFGPRIIRESATARYAWRALRMGLALGLIGLVVWGHPGILYAQRGLFDAPKLAGDAQNLANAMRDYGTRLYESKWSDYYLSSVAAIDADREGTSEPFVLWSTFAGLLEEHYGLLHPDTDYIFHALGPSQRAGYSETFQNVRPDYVQTLRRAYLPTPDTSFRQIEELQQLTYWNFYEHLLHNYEIFHMTDRSILWKRRSRPWQQLPDRFEGTVSPVLGQGTAFGSHNGEVEIPIPTTLPEETILVVKLTYRIYNPRHSIPFFGRLPRYLVYPIGTHNQIPVSLPPYAREVTFPLVLRNGENPWLALNVVAGRAGFRIDRIDWRTIAPSAESQRLLRDDNFLTTQLTEAEGLQR